MATAKRTTSKAKAKAAKAAAAVPVFHSRDERIAAGQLLRDKVPRTSHAAWAPPAKHRDPITIL